MKKQFYIFWKRNYSTAVLSLKNQLEYRFNFLIDSMIQPVLSSVIEYNLWLGIFSLSQIQNFGGFSLEKTASYALCSAFFARVAANWLYEYKMIYEIDSGSINSLLLRPISFFEYYLSQFLAYKVLTIIFSFPILMLMITVLNQKIIWHFLPYALLMLISFLVFSHTLSFAFASFSFFFNKVHSITKAKNIFLWLLTGEILPIDIYPVWIQKILLKLPFACGVFIPVGLLTGRIDLNIWYEQFQSLWITIIFSFFFGFLIWKKGVSKYAGTGA